MVDQHAKFVSTFANPDGMRALNEAETLDQAIDTNAVPQGPKPKSAFPAWVLESIKNDRSRGTDSVVPGDLDA